ncbi:MAG: type II toxin-antitoxin system HicB family antitoxin [bacterium]
MKRAFKEATYTAIFRPEPEGGFTVIVPILPGCVTYGRNIKEAKSMAREAIELYLESLRAEGEEIPIEDDSIISSVTINKRERAYA